MVIGFWILLLAFGTFGASRWLERSNNLNASVSTFSADGRKFVQLKGDRWGHYTVTVQINGQPVKALIDTGATSVSITSSVAQRLGLSSSRESMAVTANGAVVVYDIDLDQVGIGDLTQRDVSAHINPHMPGDEILLGMSFLRHFDMNIRGDVMTLREP
ncbi:MAG: TIGR02281 family clan AA aspartic protease [Granulosicoccus sp.]|nr:TIGR02281 family clan AA aspartic protease [Granulosicoccus sp.]